MQFRNIDRPSAPPVVTVTFERRQAPDEHPDLSYLEQDHSDVTDEAERAKYVAADRARLEAYNKGNWHMRGLWVRACISVPIGQGSFTMFHLDSPGLWGVESDCGTEFENEVWSEEEAELREMMATMAPELAKLAVHPVPAPRVRTVASELSSRLVAMENCRRSNNAEWLNRHERVIRAIVKNYLPSGSGFDNGVSLVSLGNRVFDGSKLVFRTSFHHMAESGAYDGWTEHRVYAVASFNGPSIRVTGSNRNDIKDHIAEVFDHALSQTLTDEYLLKAGE